jgi:hypothetical protein
VTLAHHRIPAPDAASTVRRPFTTARRTGSGTRQRQVAVPANDTPAIAPELQADAADIPIDIDDFMEVEERSTPMGGTVPTATAASKEFDESQRASLEARLIYETRAVGERRKALAGREWDRTTRRVDIATIDSTLMGLQPVTIPEASFDSEHDRVTLPGPIDPAASLLTAPIEAAPVEPTATAFAPIVTEQIAPEPILARSIDAAVSAPPKPRAWPLPRMQVMWGLALLGLVLLLGLVALVLRALVQ